MKYRAVHDAFWTDDKVLGLSLEAKTVALYLMTGPHANIIGCFQCATMTIVAALYGQEIENPEDFERLRNRYETVSEGLGELLAIGFIRRCQKTGWTWIRNHLKWNRPPNPNAHKAVVRAVGQIPPTICFYDEFLTVVKPFGYRSRTVAERLPNIDQDQDQEIDQEKKGESESGKGGPGGKPASLAPDGASSADADPDPPERSPPEQSNGPPKAKIARLMVEVWSDVCGDALPKPRKIDGDRVQLLAKHWAEDFDGRLDLWSAFCARVRAAPWLTGENDRGWRADIDFVLKRRNFRRIVEGFYDPPTNGGPSNGAGGTRRRPGLAERIIAREQADAEPGAEEPADQLAG